jgi:capsular exopolysaccharide synthesis family protein
VVTTLSLSTLFAASRKPEYQAEAQLLIKSSRTPALTGLGEEIGRLEALKSQNSPIDTQVEVIRSTPVIQEAIRELNLKDSSGRLVGPGAIQNGLKVDGVTGTDVLSISYQDGDPNKAAAIVNKVVEVFIRNNIQSNRAEAASAREFIERQLPQTEATVQRLDATLRDFKERNSIIVLEEEATAAVGIISKLEEEIANSKGQFSDAAARVQQLQTQVGLNAQQAVSYASLSQAQGVQEVLTQLQQAQRELAVERTRYRDGYPTIVNLQRRVNALDSLLQQRIRQVLGRNQSVSMANLQLGNLRSELIVDLARAETERQGLAQRIATLTETRNAYRNRARVIPRLEETQQDIQRRLDAAQKTYEALLTRLNEVKVAENQNIGNVRVIASAAVPQAPLASRRFLFVVGGLLVGGLLGVITAFGIDLIDRSVKTLREARELFGYTLLGVIPAVGRAGRVEPTSSRVEIGTPRVPVRDYPRSPVIQAYQMLQANLKFLSSDKPVQAIAVTSSVPREGKSEVSANLAATMAQAGRRTLLVDADMRNPSQHHVWGLLNTIGLSNVIVDQSDVGNAIQTVMPNLDVLPAGVIPPNPAALLDSRKMAALVEQFTESYDFVIFDMPPLAGTVDAAVLGKMVDGLLMVVRPGVVNALSANAAKDFLRQTGQTVLGMVVNGIDTRNEPDSYFYYVGNHLEQAAEPLAIAAQSDFSKSLDRSSNSN